jgi:replication factor A1
MNVADLRDGMRRVDVEGEVTQIGEPRSVSWSGGEGRVADAMLKDSSGQIKLTLWNEEIDRVKVGSMVRITNGYTKSFRSEVAVNVGRYGKLDVLE